MPPTIKVLYILGASRSGSTLLAGRLGQAAGISSHNELAWFWERGVLRDDLCGCGQPVGSCPFWSAVTAAWSDLRERSEMVVNLAQLVHRRRHVPMLLGYLRTSRHRQHLGEYGAQITALYRGIQEQTGARILVDASKSPYYALTLQRFAQLELYVLHLVRDSRATAYSWTRTKPLPDVRRPGAEMVRWSARHSAWIWLTDHLTSLLVGRRSRHYVRMRYEDFVAAPEAVLRSVIGELGLDIDVAAALTDGPEKIAHTISGNPARFESAWLTVRADDEWRTTARTRDRLLVTAMTWPLLLWFRYRLFATGPRPTSTVEPRRG